MAKSKRGKNKAKKATSKQDIDLKENVSGCDDADLLREASNAMAQGAPSDPNVPSNKEPGKQTPAHLEVILLNPSKERAEQKLESPEQRNDWIRSNPQFLSNYIAKIYARRLAQCQASEISGCNVAWCRAFLPYHLTFSFSTENSSCYHLLSVRNSKAEDPERYAKELLPLAKQFLAQERDSESPHLPFIKSTAEGKEIVASEMDHEIQERSLAHAQHILTKHGSLLQISLETSEETARLTNQRKISWTLVRLLTSPSKNKAIDYEATTTPEPDHEATTALVPGHKTVTSLEADHKATTSLEPEHQSLTSLDPNHTTGIAAKPDHNMKHDRLSPSPERIASFAQVTGCAEAHGEATFQTTDALKDPDVTESSQPMPPHKKGKSKKHKSKKNKQSSNDLQSHTAIQPALPQVSCSTTPLIVESMKDPAMNTSSYPKTHEEETPQIDRIVKTEASNNLSGTPIEMEGSAGCLICQDINDPALAKLVSDIKARKEEIRRQLIALGQPEESAKGDAAYGSATGSKSTTDSSRMPVGWAYATNTDADQTFEKAGVWLWEKPMTYFLPQSLPCAVISDRYRLAPVQISQKHTGTSEPAIIFDGKSMEIVPHTDPWPDIRSNFDHPDFLPPIRLAEFQACEVAGYAIWRQDREYMTCRKEGCDQLLYDPDPSVITCQGCGPFAGIRYCSLEHQIADMDNHHNECGSYDVLVQTVANKAATPLRFTQACPMIPTGNGLESYYSYRQKTTAVLFNGRYTIFKPFIPASTTLSWPTTHGPEAAQEMNRRIERLLNATFFGYRSHHTMRYLYCTLRALITATASPKYPHEIFLLGLTIQFALEFGYDFSFMDRKRLCECEWHGASFQGKHVTECPWSGPDAALFSETVGEGVQSELSRLEARYWILRAWQQQHPTVSDWKERAQGLGFTGSLSGTDIQQRGPGFEGWGAAESNIYD